MLPSHDHSASKKPINLSINGDLIRKAKELDINLSASLEEALEGIVRRRMSEQWLTENREAIRSYNEHVESHGVFSNGLRSF